MHDLDHLRRPTWVEVEPDDEGETPTRALAPGYSGGPPRRGRRVAYQRGSINPAFLEWVLKKGISVAALEHPVVYDILETKWQTELLGSLEEPRGFWEQVGWLLSWKIGFVPSKR
jgi:hypothetical protein